MSTAHEFWLDDLALDEDGLIRCPVDGGYQFSAHVTPAGVRLACWLGPHYIGIRRGAQQNIRSGGDAYASGGNLTIIRHNR